MADEPQITRSASPIHNLDDIPVHKIPFGEVKVLGGDQVMGFWAKLNAGSHVPNHSHPNEQITWLMKGRCDAVSGSVDAVGAPGCDHDACSLDCS